MMMCQCQTRRQTSVYVWLMGGTRFLQRSALQINETRVDRDEPRGVGEEVQMEPVDPVPNLPGDVVVQETRVTRPSTKYLTPEFDLT